MRNHILSSLFFVVLLAGCSKKDDTVFSETPDERVAKSLDALQTQLIGGQYGWVGTLVPQGGTGTPYYFYFVFKADNRVQMLSDLDVTTASVVKESSYRLKALQQPSLIFDTYSYIHMLADPDPTVAGGDAGKGFSSDFEFAYDPTLAQNDTIKLNGRFNGSKLTLVRATQQQGNDFLGGALAKAFDFNKISAYSTEIYEGASHDLGIGGQIFNYWKRFTVGGKEYEIDEGTFNPFGKSITFSWYSTTGQKSSFTTTYRFGSNKVILDKPFTAGSTVINEFTNLAWDNVAKTLTVNINATNTKTTFAGATAPIYYDTTAFTAFRNRSIAANDYWTSSYGFMKNGVFNNYGLDTLTATIPAGKHTYYYTIYYADYGTISGFRYDLFAPVFLNPAQTGLALAYGFAAVNNAPANPIVTNGIANFGFGGNLNGLTPTTGGWANTQTLFRGSPGGYYFIKLANGNYNQVAVSDAKSWMNWIW